MESSTSEVMARAIELWEADGRRREEAVEAALLRDALAELHIPAAYLDKARKDLDDKAQRARESVRSRRRYMTFALFGCLAAVFLTQTLHPYAFTAWESSFGDRDDWQLHVNRGTRAAYTRDLDSEFGSVANLVVSAFSYPTDARYFANLRATHPPRTLWGRNEMVIQVRATGSLQATRVYVRSGANERWRSPRIPLTPEWAEHRISVASFERQTGGRAAWEPAPWKTPVGLTMLQLKVGYSLNELEATGSLGLRSIRFE